jgi:hypothetical protein
MQDRPIISPDDAQQRIPFVALYQGQPAYGTNSQALPSASSDVFNLHIDKLYIFREANEVTSFLEENLFLIPLLQEAYTHIKRHFPLSDVVLEVVTDPEIMGQKDLVVFIVVKQKAEEASQALDRLDEEWWLDTLDRAEDKLHITLEFK